MNVSFQLAPAQKPHLPEASLRIALGFVANNTSRRLPISLAHNYIDRLVEHYPEAQYFLIGASSHRPYLEELCSGRPKLKDRLHNLAGTTTILELAYLLSEVDLLIATESGPAHLANSLGTPSVVLFGPESINRTAPYVKENQVRLRVKDLSCSPCFLEVCKLPETLCLLGISADSIIDSAQKLLHKTSNL